MKVVNRPKKSFLNTSLVLFFTDGISLQTWKNVGMFERELALYRGLQKKGINLNFVTYGDRWDLDIGKEIDIQVRCNTLGLPKDWYQLALQWFPPDGSIYKSNQIPGAGVALKAAKRAGAKFVARCGYLFSDFEARQFGEASSRAIKARKTEEQVFRGADMVEVTTAAAAATVNERYGVNRDKIRVVPNYVETSGFAPKQRPENKKPRLITVGRLEMQKNLGVLIEAIAPLDLELLVVGEGSLRNELENASKNANAQITFLGNVPNTDLPSILNGCDLFVLPSLYEGHPKALLEAMSCGVPILGTRVPGIQELILDRKNGILCGTETEELRENISEILKDQDLQARLGKQARIFVEENFSLERILGLEVTLLQELMTGK